MTWIKASDRKPPEGEQVLIHDDREGRMRTGRYSKGRWYVEDPQTGKLREVAGVTHWAWVLDSYLEDDSDDD
jgi:hypothetical protein